MAFLIMALFACCMALGSWTPYALMTAIERYDELLVVNAAKRTILRFRADNTHTYLLDYMKERLRAYPDRVPVWKDTEGGYKTWLRPQMTRLQ